MNRSHTLPTEPVAAYLSTDYSFTHGFQTLVIRLDKDNPELISFLEQEHISAWAYLTAWNPYSKEESA